MTTSDELWVGPVTGVPSDMPLIERGSLPDTGGGVPEMRAASRPRDGSELTVGGSGMRGMFTARHSSVTRCCALLSCSSTMARMRARSW